METKMIGNKIAKARKEMNMSQAQLAQHLFISPQAIGKWERGESMPDITTFSRLAELLGVDLNYFSDSIPSVPHEMLPVETTVKQAVQDVDNPVHLSERQVPINLTAIDLQKSDFSGVVLHKGKFKASSLCGANFAGADLTGTLFDVSDAREANFDEANLTDCNFSITDLSAASFRKSVMVRTTLNMSGQEAQFIEVNMIDTILNKTDLRKTIFQNSLFNGVDFNYCDLRGVSFEGLTFIGVKFNKSALNNASFKGATLRNVSFIIPFSVTNKSHLAMRTICFDGATMDKLTYAALKGLRVIDLSKVILI